MARLRRAIRCLVIISAWLASSATAVETFDFGCDFYLGDYEYGWSREVAPEPLDVAYADNAANNWDGLDLDHPWWTSNPRATPVDLLPNGTSTWATWGGGTTTQTASIRRRPDGYWSRRRGRDLWVYDLQLYVADITTTVCRPQGGCSKHVHGEREIDWAICGTGQRLPYRLELLEQQPHVRPGGPPAWLRMRLTHGGLPVSEGTLLTEAMRKYGPFGAFDCLPGQCRWDLRVDPDEDGRFELQFKPTDFKPAKIPLSFGCKECGNRVETTLVMQPEIVVGFFNGVASTLDAAADSSLRLEREYGREFNDVSIQYELFYNQTACGSGLPGKPSCLEDVAEVFRQRSLEMNGVLADRWEVFWDLLAGRHHQPDSFAGALRGLVGDAGNALLQLIDSTFGAMLNRLSQVVLDLLTLFTSGGTGLDQAAHLQRLQAHADQKRALLLVAHSQGNLFVNTAHDGLRATRPDGAVKVVHVAPASATLRGQHVLANIDLIINTLRLTGLNTVPPANLVLAPSAADVMGHGFERTYLDTARAGYAHTRGLISTALTALIETQGAP